MRAEPKSAPADAGGAGEAIGAMPEFAANLKARQESGNRALVLFMAATAAAVLALVALIGGIADDAFGYVVLEDAVPPESLTPDGRSLTEQDAAALIGILQDHLSRRYWLKLEADRPLDGRSRDELQELVEIEVLDPSVAKTWSLSDSLLRRGEIAAWMAENSPQGRLVFRFWLNRAFLVRSQASNALAAGVRGALIGSFLTILITLVIALPIGIGAAIYLEEYAKPNRLNRFIETNIYNLAGVPSIIYGMLGLTIFVRVLEPLTSGAFFGVVVDPTTANGRTIASAGLTLALLILPVIIINAQEALKAVPAGLRLSSLAVGTTKWQTIRHHMLPASMDRILTGTVLAVSRAVGETAPLVVVGASAFLTKDPTGIFSKFTTLPIQIYQWSARPQAEYRNAAAAAILVLLGLLLSLNAGAIILRNRYRKNRSLG